LVVAAVSAAAVPAGDGDKAKMTLEGLVSQLSATYGDELVGVALYGSAARGEQATRLSDLNVLVVVQRITMEHLRKEGPVARAWREAGNPPRHDDARRVVGSADIFPIEYAIHPWRTTRC
jgi:predicted nucleotidyltransferase